jgi:uncharacterized protein
VTAQVSAKRLGTDRVMSLDLIRGIAVLGILAINVAGFAGPPADVYAPVTHGSDPAIDSAVYALWLVLFEGKMRALFSILFGASMELFVRRAEADGRDGHALQLRRLGWLAVFGYLHWLVWWGDILFDYALAGLAALALRQAPRRLLIVIALMTFAFSQAYDAIDWLPLAAAEHAVAAHSATPGQAKYLSDSRVTISENAARDLTAVQRGLIPQALGKLADRPFEPLLNALSEIGEALPYMLLGVVLLRSGFFEGGWSRRRLIALACTGVLAGSAMTLPFAFWAWRNGYPFAAMHMAIGGGLSLAHLLTALGYAALLMLGAGSLAQTQIGQRIAAAGRMALSNYLGSTLVMTAVFYGWGLGLIGRIGTAWQAAFVILGWALILGWSAPWLARFRQGPFEWIWRSLVEGRKISLAR